MARVVVRDRSWCGEQIWWLRLGNDVQLVAISATKWVMSGCKWAVMGM